jgi:DNA-binding NarL/FixJ family response regulator
VINSSTEIRVSIIEGNKAVCTTLASIFAGTPGFRCAGAIASGEDALRALPGAEPHVVIVALRLPGISGLECITRLRVKLPKTQFVALSHFNQPDEVFDALKAGAAACVLKPAIPAKLIEAVEIVHQGGGWASPSLARSVFQYFQRLPDGQSPVDGSLTSREREILLLAKHGVNIEDIAKRLFIKRNTARTHLRNIYEKLGVRSRGEAVAKYFRL